MSHLIHRPLRLFIFLLFLGPGMVMGQEKFTIEIIDEEGNLPGDVIRFETFKQYSQRYFWLQDMQYEMFRRGYLSFSVDSIFEQKRAWIAYVHSGEKFSWAKLGRGNLDEETLGRIQFRDKIFYERTLNPGQVASLFKSILQHSENTGYPFATVRLDSIQMDENHLRAVLHLEKNQFVQIDSLVVRGTSKTHPTYFSNYLGIKPGMPYNEQSISTADAELENLAFISPFRGSEVVFTDKDTKVILYLNDKKASRFDGILGLQPDDVTGKVGITGDVKLALQNAFKRGETISFNWRRLQTATQDIDVAFDYPYLFNTPFGADLGFSLYRRDTSFVRINAHIGVSYLFSGRSYIKVFFEPHQSNVISESLLPGDGLANSSASLFGLELNTHQLNYRLNPVRGYSISLRGAAGNRTIRKNPAFDDAFYDDIPLKSVQWTGNLRTQLFTPLSPRNTILFGINGAIVQTSSMFRNEVHRIGGMQTIRGFDEESVFASAYSIFTIEYRFLLEQNSNIFAFFDGGWYELDLRDTYIRDTPFGFGLGISFETGAGIFSLTYALGRQMNNPILLRAGKIHFGFISFF